MSFYCVNVAQQSLLEDAEVALENLTRQEVQLVKEAEQLFKKQVDHVRNIDQLKKLVPNLDRIDSDNKRLASLVDSSSVLVDEVCSKFKQIDSAKVRLEDCLTKVGDILDLKTCRSGMLRSMQTFNFEEAAMYIKRFLSIDQQELRNTVGIICNDSLKRGANKLRTKDTTENSCKSNEANPSEDESAVVDQKTINSAFRELDEARSKLLHLCRDNISKAIKEENTKDIERFFKIFPMLNEHQVGLQKYSEYLRKKTLNSHSAELLKSKDMNHAEKLAVLYESIAKLIDAHQPLVETYYGPGHLLTVVRTIQKECDRLGRKILEDFRNETDLQQVAKIAKTSTLHTTNQSMISTTQTSGTGPAGLNLAPSKMDPRAVDKILNEISLIISRSEVYLHFIVKRIKDDIDSRSDASEAQAKASRLELYNMIFLECELNHLVQEVGGIYVMLEQFYLNESSKKAILMDQIDVDPSNSCLISSMLDDIFFIIKKCTKRAISTKSNEVFCAIINHCVTLLEATFCQVLEERLKDQQYYTTFSAKNLDFSQAYNAIQSGRYLQSANEQEKSNAQYFSALNNLEKACDYTKTLRGILDEDVRKLKPSVLVTEQKHDYQLEKSITCLNELTQLANKFTSIINSSLYQLFNMSLRNRVRAEFKTVSEENPDLTSVVSNMAELSSLARNLLKISDNSLESSLLPENYAKLVSITRDFLASSIKTIK